jgi:CRP-like cAMP-binding protein
MEIEKFLGGIEPFRAMSLEEVRQISFRVREHSFRKGETIFTEGDPADSVWILYKGRIQVFKSVNSGKPFAVESLGAGELFGTLCRLGGQGRSYPCTAIAADRTVALRLSDKVFFESYNKSPGLVRGICALCSERLKDVQDLRCVGQESVQIRIASTLLRLLRVHGPIVPFTKREISELVGATIETTFRTLTDLQKKGVLESLRGKIRIKKPEKLKALSHSR